MAKLFNQSAILLVLVGFLVLATADPLKHDSSAEVAKNDAASAQGGEGCKCGDDKLKEFASKFALLFRAYASKELVPEVRALAGKLVDFVLTYLAKEKPDEMDKFHNFLQDSVKVVAKNTGKS